MSFKEKLNKLPQDKIADLELITNKIIETGLAEIIILYGSHARGDFKDGKIVEIEGTHVLRRSDYDILVVIDQPDEKQEIEKIYRGSFFPKIIGSTSIAIRRKLEGLDLSVQVIVEQIKEINKRLKEKQYFYSDIKREGVVLYDTGKCQLSEPPKEVTPAIRRQYAEDHFEAWFTQAKGALRSAKHDINDKDYKWAAFHLEQIVEMCYKCILLVYTHYSPHEHDLYKLREEAEKCEPLLQAVFPTETDRQKDLFAKLHLSYIGARYIRSFTIELNEINYWKVEVEKLLSLTEQTCKSKIEVLRQIEMGAKKKHD